MKIRCHLTAKVCAVISVLLISSCGGALPQTTIPLPSNVEGLEISSQMSLVAAKGSASSSVSSTSPQLIQYAVPTSGEYVTDPVELYVFDQAMEPLNQINDVLCHINQSAYESQVNAGDYLALVDEELCNRDRGSSINNQSSAQEKNFQQWFVNVERLSNQSEQIVKCWIPQFGSEEDDAPDDLSLKGQLIVEESVSTANPFGIFTMYFGVHDGSGTLQDYGAIKSSTNDDGDTVLEMTSYESVWSQNVEMSAVLDVGSDSGYGYIFKGIKMYSDSDGLLSEPEKFGTLSHVAFDSDYYRVHLRENLYYDVEKEICLDRNNYTRNVWGYNLYHGDGSRVNISSGFPVIHDDTDWGFADFYGIHFSEELNLDLSGATVQDEEGQSYTVVQGGGRLIKRTRLVKTLGELTDDLFEWYDDSDGEIYQISWNGSQFYRMKRLVYDSNYFPSFVPVTPTAVVVSANQWIGLWKEGFGSVDVVVPDGGVLTDALEVPYYTQEFVSPAEAASLGNLYCYYSCPKGGLTVAHLNDNSPYYDDEYYDGSNPYVYTFDSNRYVLQYSGQDVQIESGATVSDTSYYSWGLQSGAMVTSILNDPWDAWEQNVIYYWETGPNDYNKYSALIDSNGQSVMFEAPLNCDYNDDEYGTFVLQYHGEGHLSGIPYDRVVDSETEFEHWVARFALDDGTALSCDGQTYYVKAMNVEQYMNEVDLQNCSHLAIPSAIAEPELEFDSDMIEIGDAPAVTGGPRVIGGVVQE